MSPTLDWSDDMFECKREISDAILRWMTDMGMRTALAALGFVALAGLVKGLSPSPLSVELRESDWGIASWATIRQGELGIMHTRKGDELQVYALTMAPRPSAVEKVHSATPGFSGSCYLVDSFDSGTQNRLGGYFNSFMRSPSSAAAALGRWDDNRRALTLDFRNAGIGFSGMWVHLFDFRQPLEERVYLDVTPFSLLTFWFRLRRGDERILVKASDARWEQRQDSLPIGELSSFLSGNKSKMDWQQAMVPIASLPPGLNRREMAALVFETLGNGAGGLGVKDLAFCKGRDQLPSLSPPLVPDSEGGRELESALWVWNTREILDSADRQGELLDFARNQKITDLFLQLPNENDRLGPRGEIQLEAGVWKTFLAVLNEKGLRAHALDGFKNHALPEWHERVLATVDNVLRFNQSVAPSERFFGIHYDIEPYLLPGFPGPKRERILCGYLELLQKIAAKTRAAGMVFGVDMPFWYDAPIEMTGKPFLLEFNGARKLPSEHVIDLSDQIGVMDYRTTAYGADGVLALAQGELDYAARKGKRVFIGLETTELPDEDLLRFEGEPSRGFPDIPPAERCVVVAPGAALSKLWLVLSSDWVLLRHQIEENRQHDPLIYWWPTKTIARVPGHKLTFADLGIGRLNQTMAEAIEEFRRYRSFAGYAIHDYIGYRKLLGLAP